MSGLEVRAEQENETRVCIVRRRAIGALPQRIAYSCSRRTDVCVRVVPVNTPRLEHAIDVAFVPGPAYVIDDFVAAVFDQRGANFKANVSSTSSQVVRSHWPSPRGPTRLSG